MKIAKPSPTLPSCPCRLGSVGSCYGQITESGQRGVTTSQLWRITRHSGYYYGGERDGVGDLLAVLDELVEHGSIVSIEPVEEPGETIHYATRYAPQ